MTLNISSLLILSSGITNHIVSTLHLIVLRLDILYSLINILDQILDELIIFQFRISQLLFQCLQYLISFSMILCIGKFVSLFKSLSTLQSIELLQDILIIIIIFDFFAFIENENLKLAVNCVFLLVKALQSDLSLAYNYVLFVVLKSLLGLGELHFKNIVSLLAYSKLRNGCDIAIICLLPHGCITMSLWDLDTLNNGFRVWSDL